MTNKKKPASDVPSLDERIEGKDFIDGVCTAADECDIEAARGSGTCPIATMTIEFDDGTSVRERVALTAYRAPVENGLYRFSRGEQNNPENLPRAAFQGETIQKFI